MKTVGLYPIQDSLSQLLSRQVNWIFADLFICKKKNRLNPTMTLEENQCLK